VRFAICTGDSLLTAKHISEQLGMPRDCPCFDSIPKDLLQIQGRNLVFAKFGAYEKSLLIKQWREQFPNSLVMMFGDQKNDEMALQSSQYGFVQEDGCFDSKIAAKSVVKDLTGVYWYLFLIRRLRLFGQFWLVNQFHIFNTIMSAVCLMGLHIQHFSKKGVLYMDPWNPLSSLVLTNVTAFFLIILSYYSSFYSRPSQLNFEGYMIHLPKTAHKTLFVFVSSLIAAYVCKVSFSLENAENSNVLILMIFILTFIDSLLIFVY